MEVTYANFFPLYMVPVYVTSVALRLESIIFAYKTQPSTS
jgi:hypothetical protein